VNINANRVADATREYDSLTKEEAEAMTQFRNIQRVLNERALEASNRTQRTAILWRKHVAQARTNESIVDVAKAYLARVTLAAEDAYQDCPRCTNDVLYSSMEHTLSKLTMSHHTRIEIQNLAHTHLNYMKACESHYAYKRCHDVMENACVAIQEMMGLTSVLMATTDVATQHFLAQSGLDWKTCMGHQIQMAVEAIGRLVVEHANNASYLIDERLRPSTARRDVLREIFSNVLNADATFSGDSEQTGDFVEVSLDASKSVVHSAQFRALALEMGTCQ